MRIVSIEVQGFGVLRERTLLTDSPLVLLYGANEAGKSTLMGFVRAVLFGFPSRGSRAERYEPPMGGAHGGALTLLDGQGQRIRVERYSGSAGARRSSAGIVKVTLGDGTTGGEELLHALLGGLSADLFRSLFAFGLSELQELRTLQTDEISGYLYSAGLGVSGSVIMDAERKLALQAETLYRPRGRNQEINKLLKELDELNQSLRQSKERVGEYDILQEKCRASEQQIAALELGKQELRAELDELSLAKKARVSWIRLNQIAAELDELPHLEQFPEQATARYEALEEELERYSEEGLRLANKEESLKANLMLLKPNEGLLTYKVELNALLEQAPVYQESERAMLEAEAELSQLDLELDRLLGQLGGSWEASTLAAFPVSISLRERIRDYRERFSVQQERSGRLQAERHHLVLQTERLEAAVKTQEQELKSSAARSAAGSMLHGMLMEGQDPAPALSRIAKDFSQWRQLHSEHDHVRERELDRQRYREELQEAAARERLLASQRRRSLGFTVLGIALILSAFLLWKGEGVLSGVLMGIGIVVFLFLFLTGTRSVSGSNALRSKRGQAAGNNGSEVPPTGDEKLRSLEEQLYHYKESLERQVGKWFTQQETAAAGEKPERNLNSYSNSHSEDQNRWSAVLHWLNTSLVELQQEVEKDSHRQGELQRKLDKLSDAQQTLLTLVRQDDQLAVELEMLTQEGDKLQEEWGLWLRSLGLADSLSPDAVLESLQLVELGHELIRRQGRLKSKVQLIREQRSSFERDTAMYLGSAAGSDAVLALKRWKEAEKHELELQDECERIRQQLVLVVQESQLLVERHRRASVKLESLLQEAAALNGEQLRQNQNKQERRAKLLEEQRMLSGTMETLAGTTYVPRLQVLLDEIGEEELKRRSQNLEQRIKLAEEEANGLRELLGKLTSEIGKLELGVEHTDKLQKAEVHRASLEQMIDQYAVASFASLLMKKAREAYERDRQPGVLIRASAYFEQMTQGKYKQIKAPFGEQRLVAIREDGQTLDTGSLSRGTSEQLYLAMRLALAEEYAGKAVLPLVMDDILVNFDERRMESCLLVLSELSKKHQILLFTCHAHVRDAAVRLIPQQRLIEL
ncbi:AAA family ATPase [Paenibacillus eucommiae]|uniref:Uncharacterized protein YhaN n=1 Tax=Paenibacillus eucommiae TaxID=1355755 RepID=A0ABS4INS5_9BACL|nr:AAA family ATPase [Paenibacillus eucommiae]MBP1989212.1 uncharacterized protein YhaN [Paenibacillus eucommiae]